MVEALYESFKGIRELVATNTATTSAPRTKSLLRGKMVIRPDLNSSLPGAFHVFVLLMLFVCKVSCLF